VALAACGTSSAQETVDASVEAASDAGPRAPTGACGGDVISSFCYSTTLPCASNPKGVLYTCGAFGRPDLAAGCCTIDPNPEAGIDFCCEHAACTRYEGGDAVCDTGERAFECTEDIDRVM